VSVAAAGRSASACGRRANSGHKPRLPETAFPGGVVGGAERDRTADLLRAKQALSQLSYGPSWMVGLGGFEPPTSPLSGVRSNQLSYKPTAPVDDSTGSRRPSIETGGTHAVDEMDPLTTRAQTRGKERTAGEKAES